MPAGTSDLIHRGFRYDAEGEEAGAASAEAAVATQARKRALAASGSHYHHPHMDDSGARSQPMSILPDAPMTKPSTTLVTVGGSTAAAAEAASAAGIGLVRAATTGAGAEFVHGGISQLPLRPVPPPGLPPLLESAPLPRLPPLPLNRRPPPGPTGPAWTLPQAGGAGWGQATAFGGPQSANAAASASAAAAASSNLVDGASVLAHPPRRDSFVHLMEAASSLRARGGGSRS